ncbi:MAG: SRPBCC domain-containing protein [Deltaproteobacteria bacterium]|nr:SRPBCC domain-containing protein [Deltaproteobacteria bacterium]
MLTLRTEIQIAATPERVWNILMDFPAHGQWNPFVRSLEGTPRVGETLKVFIQPPGGRGMQFRPKVLVVEVAREFRWKGKLLVTGLFDGEHFFILEQTPDGTVLFTQGEIFSGLLVPLMKKSLEGPTKNGFIAMNEALKRLAEAPRSFITQQN